ncbi:MAG: CARDB domain-containing protein [candidate division WOR-3 bacterium]
MFREILLTLLFIGGLGLLFGEVSGELLSVPQIREDNYNWLEIGNEVSGEPPTDQEWKEIGSGTYAQNWPFSRASNYSTWEGIYLQSEIDIAGYIGALGFYTQSTANTTIENVSIYMRETTATSFSGDGYIVLPPGPPWVLVWEGTWPNSQTGWNHVYFTTPFHYSNHPDSNLLILIVKAYQPYVNPSPTWRYHAAGATLVRRAGSNDDQPTYLQRAANRPNTRLGFVNYDVSCLEILSPTGTVNFGEVIQPRATVKNNGNTEQTFNVRFWIEGTKYEDVQEVTLGAGEETEVTFADWTAGPVGTLAVKCTTELTYDMDNTNDKQTGSVFVRYLDAQCLSIVQPTGTVVQGTTIAPKAIIKNNGNTPQNITVRFIIEDGSGYNYTVTQSLDPNQELEYTFPDWTANNLGSWTVKCTTELTGDMNNANDKQEGSVFVQYLDAQCVSIDAPTGTVNLGDIIQPKATVKNNGNTGQTFNVRFWIEGTKYEDVQEVTLGAGEQVQVTFADWTAGPVGTLAVKCTTELTYDMDNSNDMQQGSVTVQTGGPPPSAWQKLTVSVPEAPSNKKIKSGGLIVYGDDKIYIVKGNNTKDFYAFVPETAPTPLDSVPVTGKKGVKKGTGMVYDGTRWLYFASGTNTLQFWKYDTQGESGWVALPDIPTGGGKALKGGTGMAYVNGLVYLLKGSKTNEFYAFDCANNTWIETLPKAPEGSYTGKGYADGSCLVAYDENTLYALRGKYNEFYKYDISNNTWTSDSGMPFTHPMWNKKKKVGEGAAMTLRGNKIYAFKGNNTKEFWSLIPGSGWVGLETIPKGDDKKYVKGGGGLCTWTDGKIYALKGNNTTSIWRYTGEDFPLAATLPNTAPMENITGKRLSEIGLRILPNPTKGLIKVYYNLPKRELATLKIYNTLGRVVYLGRSDKGEFTIKRLPAGIYLLRFESKGYKEERKLIVVK